MSVLHPFVVLPFAGQLLLLITLFQKNPGRLISLSGMILIGILMVLLLIIGLLGNWKIALSSIPFLIIAFISVKHQRTLKKQ